MAERAGERPKLAGFLWGGAVAGGTSALVNVLYLAAHRAATGLSLSQPTLGSVVVSSIFPSLLGALAYGLLSRWTDRATSVFVIVTSGITFATFESIFRTTLPDGAPKPPGFDLLVMPMHVVVGALAIVIIPRIARGRPRPRGPG